jgi:hypothetical protein
MKPLPSEGFFVSLYLFVMEKGIQKLLRKLVLKKYPMYLDVQVVAGTTGHPYAHLRACSEVFLITFEQEYKEDIHVEVKNYINNLGKYMDERICGVWREVVTEEQWEEIKSYINETPN